ncbi:RagB/SusD family nutrient uptake outer membrane protein [Niastella populi]|uniref:Carbohydrate-binding protein SusD n=1 Tax=Niastella populi TaxID=550983 RepID=A0A1V9FZB9_9BACT|nr:RagB/SusD family nutrient uptake outer membrane protein [Niastella populi]OQP63586.1 hypothetical protein A4R26_16540 [Niastella populi]
MKKLRNLSYAAAVLLVTSATSCKKQLEEYNPHSGTAENLWNNPEGFKSLVNSAYQELHFLYGQEDGFFLLETGSDLWYSAGRSGYARQIVYYEALQPGQGQTTKAWTSFYKSINLCNAGINRIDDANFTNETEKNNRLGELRFLRALYNFHLVEQFGGVMLKTKESADGVDLYAKRNTPEEFYDVIISDLEFAKNNLPVSWPAAEYSRATKKAAMGMLAKAYLTRAYYSTGADAQSWFTKAKDAAVELINNRTALGTDLFQTFKEVGASVNASTAARATNKEALFVLAYSQENSALNALTGANGNRIFKWAMTKYRDRPGMENAYVNAYGVDNEQRVMPTWHLLDLFDETKDVRYSASFQETWFANKVHTWTAQHNPVANYGKDASVIGKTINIGDTAMRCKKGDLGYDGKVVPWMAVGSSDLYINPVHGQGAAIDPGKVITNYFPSLIKFMNPNRTWTGTTDFADAMIMRLAEVYLIAAEAYVGLGDPAGAVPYVNRIRERAALTPGALDVTAADINIEFILDERAREFAGELLRWYDLKRVFHDQSKWVEYIKKWNPDQTLIEPYHWLRPVPTAELNTLLNPKEFGQNPGYLQP